MSATILVVDDSAADRLIIKSLLHEHQVLIACDGLEAMRQIDEHADIDLVILDLNMPDMNGFQVLQALQSNERYRKLHTIILTNYDELDSEIKGLELGAMDYIRKPVQMASLKARIDVHLELLRIQRIFEQQFFEQSMTLDAIFQQAPIGIAILYGNEPSLDDNNELVAINPLFEQITGRTKEELIKLGWAKITHPEDLEEDLQNFKKLQSGEIKNYSMEKRYIKPDGSIVWVHMVVAALTLSNQTEFNHISLIQDISQRKEMENDLRYNSEHDLWTGLYNRRYFENLLRHDARKETTQKRAVVGLNLSAVHSLSLTYGFQYSQEFIKRITDALKFYCQENCQLFNTYENRFILYVRDYKDKNDLTAFCKNVVNTLESLLAVERISFGIGVIEIDESNQHDPEQLLKNLLIASEKAMDAVDSDFGFCFFNRDMESQIIREEEIKRELAEIAADENSSRLFLQFQPVFDLGLNQICGFEALARLNSDKYGLIPPLEFIPIAEKTKLIIPLGNKIILQAFRFLNTLKEKGHDTICVSINISVIQLLKNDFVNNLFEMIAQMQVDPENIGLELTESIFASDYQEINSILGELKDSGIHIAIDDFGTGYSSLARERELNINCLKIDQYFIGNLLSIHPEDAITCDIISMGHKRGHCVIAEGVEHDFQLQYLKNHGCDRIQGYLISKPLDEAAAIELLNKHLIINNDCL